MPKIQKIILIDDEPLDALHVSRHISRAMPDAMIETFHSVKSLTPDRLAACPPETLFILDYYLEAGNSAAFIAELREREDTLKIAPVVVVTGSSERLVAMSVVDSGADELLYKQSLNAETIQLALIKATRAWHRRQRHIKQMAQLTQVGNMLAHDLRNPISGMIGATELLSENPEMPEEALQLLDAMKTAAEQSLDLINERLEGLHTVVPDFDRPATSPDRAVAMLEDVRLLYALQLANKRANLRANMTCDIPLPPRLMKQILTNLVDNSIKFSRPAPLNVTIESFQRENNVVLQYSDNGQGIPEDDLGKIFEPTNGASGNGLPHLASLVREHGGDIVCQSDGKESTTFQIVLQ